MHSHALNKAWVRLASFLRKQLKVLESFALCALLRYT